MPAFSSLVINLLFLSINTGIHALPLFGIHIGSPEASGNTTPVPLATVNSTFFRPAQFARAAYCPSASVQAWDCGNPCQAIKGVTITQTGGDQGLVPFYFIAHDASDQSIVVAHEGTDPHNLLSLLNDAEFLLKDPDTNRFANAAGKGIKVHDGFQQTFERTADGILSGVKSALASTGVKKVLVTGHSQGAALATMTGAMLKGALASSGVNIEITTFAPPRSGNVAWANYLDANAPTTFVTNQNDPVPSVPPLLFGYAHPSGEIHIPDSSQQNFVACPGQDNKHCISGNDLIDASIQNHLGPYFDNISFGASECS